MKVNNIILEEEEHALLQALDAGEGEEVLLSDEEKQLYQESASYTKSLQEKRQTTIRFSVRDLAIIKARAKEMGIGYQTLIQALVHSYAHNKTKLEL